MLSNLFDFWSCSDWFSFAFLLSLVENEFMNISDSLKGEGSSKKEAKENGARKMLEKMDQGQRPSSTNVQDGPTGSWVSYCLDE